MDFNLNIPENAYMFGFLQTDGHLKQQMVGIYSTSVGSGTLDEAPDAYKPAKIIVEPKI